MSGTLSVYRSHLASGDLDITIPKLRGEGYSESNARLILHRLCKDGAATRLGKGRIRLLKPGESALPAIPPWQNTLKLRFKAQPTGFSILPNRYPAGAPAEFLVPSKLIAQAADVITRNYPALRISIGTTIKGKDSVCLFAAPKPKPATMEQALLHLYRHAPRQDFALALQALLMKGENLDFRRWRTAPEWPELAGMLRAINEMTGKRIFPWFRMATPPDLTYEELETIAQAFTARGGLS